MAEKEEIRRSLDQVPDDELLQAVSDMSNKLGIPGSSGHYSLCAAVIKEKNNLIKMQKIIQENLGDK